VTRSCARKVAATVRRRSLGFMMLTGAVVDDAG
jgi:hypothetical protein